MNSKRKGTAGENELAEFLRGYGIRAYRTNQIFTSGKNNPDVCAEIAGRKIHVEVKRVEKLNISEAMNQAMKDASPDSLPVVAHRRNREKWLLTIPLFLLLDTLRDSGVINKPET